MVVEELLKLLVAEVDAELLEPFILLGLPLLALFTIISIIYHYYQYHLYSLCCQNPFMTSIIIILIYHYLLISIVLFEPVEREDLEACDVKDPDEDGFFLVEHMIYTIL